MKTQLQSYLRTSKRTETERDRLVREHAPLVYRIVRNIAQRLPSTVDRECLFSAGMLGLLDAHAKYNQGRGVSFEAYARIRVKGAILDELRSLDHLSRRDRRTSRAVQEAQQSLEKSAGCAVSDEEVAARAGLSIEEVQATQAHRAAPESVDPAKLDLLELGDAASTPPSALEQLEAHERVRRVSEALTALPERNRLVAGLYYEAEMTLREIGDLLGVTESRISQLLSQTTALIRAHLAAEEDRGGARTAA